MEGLVRFLGACAGVAAGLALELQMGQPAPDFALAALLAFSVLISFGELVALVLLAVLAISWAPVVSAELVWFAALPLIAAFAGRIAALRLWASNLLILGIGVFLFYVVNDAWFITRNPELFGRLWLGAVVFGAVLFHLYRFLFMGWHERLLR